MNQYQYTLNGITYQSHSPESAKAFAEREESAKTERIARLSSRIETINQVQESINALPFMPCLFSTRQKQNDFMLNLSRI